MELYFRLEDKEDTLTPMTVADALIKSTSLKKKDLLELSEYLATYVKYNAQDIWIMSGKGKYVE